MTTELYTDPSKRQAEKLITSRQAGWMTLAKVIAGFFSLYLVLQVGLALLIPRIGPTWGVLITAVTMLCLAVVFQAWFFQGPPLEALRQLGYGRPRWRAIVVALILSGVMLLFFPAVSVITGVRLGLNSGWLWTLAGIVVFNGLAEETLFRGYVFGNLRQGRSFLHAGFISLLLFAAAHLYLFVGNPFIIALAGTLVALIAAFPMAYLFERGNNTIWAPVILHIVVHGIRLFAIPEKLEMPVVMAWLALQIFLPLLLFAFRRYLKG
jgi:membrane protease YdiL (CAAX protease family)